MNLSLFVAKTILILALIVGIYGCSSARYKGIPRAETRSVTKCKIPKATLELAPLPESQNNNIHTTRPLLQQNIAILTKEQVIASEPIMKGLDNTYPNFHRTKSLPEDSIEIDIRKETKQAENYGHTGYILALVAVGLSVLTGIGVLLALVGMVFSVIAFYKMKAYELNVKNRNKIIAGLIINSLLVLLTILVITLLVLFFF